MNESSGVHENHKKIHWYSKNASCLIFSRGWGRHLPMKLDFGVSWRGYH